MLGTELRGKQLGIIGGGRIGRAVAAKAPAFGMKAVFARRDGVPSRGAGRVRLLRIPGIDLQPCGGTHVANIAEIGGIRVLRIRSEGKHNKRVEIALTGSG